MFCVVLSIGLLLVVGLVLVVYYELTHQWRWPRARTGSHEPNNSRRKDAG